MLQFERNLTIPAPVEKVFDYVFDRTHLPGIWPSLLQVKGYKLLPTGGYTFGYVYKMAGMQFEGIAEDIEYVPNERLVTKVTGGIEGTITFRFEPIGTQTKAYFLVSYTLPPTLPKVEEPAIVQFNEHEATLMLENLKTHFEVGVMASR
jgi:uncharacterized protein YndB with AHSA1/START domain